jgi:hypothetical protein
VRGLLIGFETLNPDNLHKMRKSFNLMPGIRAGAREPGSRFGCMRRSSSATTKAHAMRPKTLAFAERHASTSSPSIT